nr:ribonuclease H-like domain-containing protein [Tanacetum cinerariifolium]
VRFKGFGGKVLGEMYSDLKLGAGYKFVELTILALESYTCPYNFSPCGIYKVWGLAILVPQSYIDYCKVRPYRLCDSFDENNLFIFNDESVRNSPVSRMSFRKKPRDSMNVRSNSNSNKSLPRTVHMWLLKIQPLAEPVAKWIPRVKHCPDLSLDHRFGMFKSYDGLCDSFDENNLFIFNDESIVQICLWIIDSGCSTHMTGNCALLTNFVEKFLGRFALATMIL